jgi:uncharacterized damage-inducible protein DinB
VVIDSRACAQGGGSARVAEGGDGAEAIDEWRDDAPENAFIRSGYEDFFEDYSQKRRRNMSIAEAFLAEFEIQAPITRRFLERLPEDKLTWKPHTKSMSAGQLAYHLGFVPGGALRFVQNNPAQAPASFNFPQPGSRAEILEKLDESIATVRSLLPNFDDAAMKETWRLIAGGREVLVRPRAEFLRDVMLSHWYQHRGQFSVYLRMLDVAVPASWGPSADEPPIFMQNAKAA